MPLYKRAPITEAVIEFRYEQQLQKEAVDSIHNRLKQHYTISEPVSFVDVQLEIDERQAKFTDVIGHRLASSDRADVHVVQLSGMICSRMAPYLGWESFCDRAKRDWGKWKDAIGYRKIARIGVRFINRIDIPYSGESRLRLEDFLKIYPQYPDQDLPPLSNYTMQMQGELGAHECRLTVNSGLVPSPLVRHASLLLDIDIGRDRGVPQADSDVWKLIEEIRKHKNRIFEASVTNRARELFS